jgi:hypothetical protein
MAWWPAASWAEARATIRYVPGNLAHTVHFTIFVVPALTFPKVWFPAGFTITFVGTMR